MTRSRIVLSVVRIKIRREKDGPPKSGLARNFNRKTCHIGGIDEEAGQKETIEREAIPGVFQRISWHASLSKDRIARYSSVRNVQDTPLIQMEVYHIATLWTTTT